MRFENRPERSRLGKFQTALLGRLHPALTVAQRGVRLEIKDGGGNIGSARTPPESEFRNGRRLITTYRFKATKATTIISTHVDANRWPCGYRLYDLKAPALPLNEMELEVSFAKRLEFMRLDEAGRRAKGCRYWTGDSECRSGTTVSKKSLNTQSTRVVPQEQRVSTQKAKEIERSLGIRRETRFEIQRSLKKLGYRPGTIDGVFGPATRGAIKRWQRANGISVTGYLAAWHVARLREQSR